MQASAGTNGKAGLLIRTQNCSATVGGSCVACSGAGQKASRITFSELLNNDNSSDIVPRFAPVTNNSVVFGPHDHSDLLGTEDPRVAYDAASGIYYMFYTCYGDGGRGSVLPTHGGNRAGQTRTYTLCLATTSDPTSNRWTRHGAAFPGEHKSGAMLIRDSPPHYLISGAGRIMISKTSNLLNWTLVSILQTLSADASS